MLAAVGATAQLPGAPSAEPVRRALDANLAAVSENVLPPGTPPGVETSVLMNHWIQVVAALVLPAVVGWILVRYVEPGLAPYSPSTSDSSSAADRSGAEVTASRRRAEADGRGAPTDARCWR